MVKITGGAGAPLFGNNKNRMNCSLGTKGFYIFPMVRALPLKNSLVTTLCVTIKILNSFVRKIVILAKSLALSKNDAFYRKEQRIQTYKFRFLA